MILTLGTLKMVRLILGIPHMSQLGLRLRAWQSFGQLKLLQDRLPRGESGSQLHHLSPSTLPPTIPT